MNASYVISLFKCGNSPRIHSRTSYFFLYVFLIIMDKCPQLYVEKKEKSKYNEVEVVNGKKKGTMVYARLLVEAPSVEP